MEDLHDHASPIKHLRTGCSLEVACLAGGYLVVHDHELRLGRRIRIRLDLRGTWLILVGVLEALAGLGLVRDCHRADDARPACNRTEFLKPPLSQHRPAPIWLRFCDIVPTTS
jgi:hypothetical protein